MKFKYFLSVFATVASVAHAQSNPILFVTQVPMPTEINSRQITGSVVNVSSPFGNHLGDTSACGRGGALWIRYADGTLANLTALAGYGTSGGFQGATSIAVREPSVHWSGTKALFSMVVGAPTGPGDATVFVWQIYEITNFAKGQIPVITKVANQPPTYNNVSPTYGTDGRIIFASDRPRDGAAHLYPLREEYLQQPTVTGLWSLNPNTPGDLFLLQHSPSGSFRPFIDSAGRVLFTRWDHLARDVEAVTDKQGTSTNNVFNYSDESAVALVTTNKTEIFPEPRPSDTNALAGTNMRGNAFNEFFPWQVNEDGTAEEVVNHVGRHELLLGVQSSTFTNDPNIVSMSYYQRYNTNYVANFFLATESPTVPGLLYGIDALDIGTHTAGQIVTLTAATNINPDVMLINYITPKATAFPNPAGLYRNPLPLTDGSLVAVYAPGATTNDFNMGTPTAPKSKYDFRLRTMTPSGGTFTPTQFLTTGFTNSVSYYVGTNLITYAGPMWELDPVEVAARPAPASQASVVDPIEAGVFSDEGVNLPAFRSWLVSNEYALVVGRNVTARDRADKQQPYNLKVAWSGTQTLGTNGTVYPVAYLQLFQADQLRGFKPDGVNPAPGRRVLAQPWHDSIDDNPPVVGGGPGSVQLGNDGSFAAILPARRAMSWQLTDTNAAPVVRERYWVTFQPGEVRTCANCHGVNSTDQAGQPRPTNKSEALKTLLKWWKVVNLPQTPGTIMFLTARDGNNEIYSMNPEGGNVTNLTQNLANDVLPRVSYDGKKIVFASDRGHTGNMDIWTMNNDGSNLFNVTKTNFTGSSLWGPAMNFDGSKIVYMGPHTPANRYDLFTCNADGTGVTNLTANTGDGSFPYWSYDGSKIVFGSYRDVNSTNSGEEVYIMNANGSGQKRLTFSPGRDFYPVISPDGSKIAFTTEREGHRQIYMMNATDGSGQTNISNNAFGDQNAYFSPDGKRLSFTSSRDGGSDEVYVMNIDGSNQTRLTTNSVLEAYPAWGNTPPSSPPPPLTFTLTVNSGTGSGSYTNGTVVAITANAPPAGQVFDQWTGATVANAFAASTTLTMPAANTTVTATYKPVTYTLAVNSGTGSGSYTAGTVVPIVANAPPAGQVFDKWLGATVANAFATSTTLTMPAANTSVYATYKPATYTLTVNSGTGSGSYTNGTVVSIAANPPPSGQIFYAWSGATVANVFSSSTTLTMPGSNTTVTANYTTAPPATYALTVNSGTGSGSYTNGQVVSITANAPPAGQVFNQWPGATVANPLAASTTLTMPAANTSVTATYKPATYTLAVNNGTGSGTYTNGQVVSIVANAPPAGQVFDKWLGATVADAFATSTTLTMPAANTSVYATYKPATYTLTVNSGTGSGTYTNGQVVSISANSPPAGQVFDRWTGATVANALAASTTLTMPAASTSVTATYKPATYTLTVNFGAGSGTYTNGQVVSIVANAPPAGQVFDQWLGATVANAFAASTTLSMPAANTSVYATYKTAPLPLAITTSSPLPDCKVGVAYSQTLLATDGTPGYAWSIFSGALPGGLTLNALGSISGSPTSAGGFSFTAQVSDSASATATKAFAITVNPAINNITFTPTNGPVATVVTISGSGFTGTTAVLFNGANAGFTSTSDTQIIAAVPFGATTGSITIIGAGGTVPSVQPFTVTPSTELPAIYVADTNNHRIQKSTDGLTWTQIGLGYGTGLGQFRYPEAVAASGDGQTIYVADKSNNRIQKSTDGGATWAIFADSTLVNGPQGVALAINGDVYVSSTAGNSVLRFAGGNPAARTIIAGNGTSSGTVTQVKAPYGLAVDANNTLYIADRNNYRILRIDHADTSVASVVVAGRGSLLSPGQVSVPQGVGLDNSGNLYVADSGNNRVLKFAAGNPGVAVALATNGTSLSPAQVRGAEGVTVSLLPSGPFAGQHLLVVGDTGNYRIVGKPLTEGVTAFTSFGGNGTAVGQFKSPGKIR